ncbi:Uncharacterized protein SCF082_LOCUS53084 [Durusdinium trenchii]|uniref:Uncharacterized protein n=1 Tax=Durusdinium trenchii TaxID=1381693 RepID=A0ABP0SQE3_9DINO
MSPPQVDYWTGNVAMNLHEEQRSFGKPEHGDWRAPTQGFPDQEHAGTMSRMAHGQVTQRRESVTSLTGTGFGPLKQEPITDFDTVDFSLLDNLGDLDSRAATGVHGQPENLMHIMEPYDFGEPMRWDLDRPAAMNSADSRCTTTSSSFPYSSNSVAVDDMHISSRPMRAAAVAARSVTKCASVDSFDEANSYQEEDDEVPDNLRLGEDATPDSTMAAASMRGTKRSIQFCSVCFGIRRQKGKLVMGHKPDGYCPIKQRRATADEKRELRRRRQKMRRAINKRKSSK